MTDPRLKIGGNNPPEETPTAPPKAERELTFLDRLEAKFSDLSKRYASHELKKRKLPAIVTSDEEVATINAWVVEAKKLSAEYEAHRVETKAPYLEREREIDGWFTPARDSLKKTADTIAQRSKAYLDAKAKAAEAARVAEAMRKRREAEEQAAELQRLQNIAAEAQRKREAEEEALRQAEMAKVAEPSTAEPGPPPQADPEAEARLRKATQEADDAQRAVSKAADVAVKVERQAERAERSASSPTLGRTQGGGGASRITEQWVGDIVDRAALDKSLGPLAVYLGDAAILSAINRAARSIVRPDLPGVQWRDESKVRVSTTKNT